jgi:ABC-type dipeptide/oligopeptide/nickel transport system permease component
MPPFLQFLIRRIIAIPISLIIITMLLYAGVMMTPPETRAAIYSPEPSPRLTDADVARLTELSIKKYHLRDPYLVQYGFWVKSLLQGTWGYSPTIHENVLPALLRRTPATAELTLYSVLFFIPLGLVSGVFAGWRQRRAFDNTFRFMAFVATSLPPFILALVFLSLFYVNLHWFAPGRIAQLYSFQISDPAFRSFTGLYTLDTLLNGRFDIFVDALRHLAMPVFTLSIYHWATLGRITRSTIISERHKEYLVAAQSRGLTDQHVIWKHAFWNVLAPSFTSMALSAASLVTGVFVVEIIYYINGVSDIIVRAMQGSPDAPAALGFCLYSIVMVLFLMFVLDILQAIFDPRIREDLLNS